MGVYVVVVVGGGVLIGRTDSPSLGLSVVATAIVALGFERVQSWLETAVAGRVHGGTPSPYDVLSRFSETVTGGYATEEVPGPDGDAARAGHRSAVGAGLADRPGRADPRGDLAQPRRRRT